MSRVLTPDAPVAAAAPGPVHDALGAQARWRWWELGVFGALALSWFVVPGQSLIASEIAILALFALSLDLVLGYAGIVSLGHAAFFGVGAYAAALFAKHAMPDPLAWPSPSACRRCWAWPPARSSCAAPTSRA